MVVLRDGLQSVFWTVVICTSEINCLDRLVSEMISCALNGMLNSTLTYWMAVDVWFRAWRLWQ